MSGRWKAVALAFAAGCSASAPVDSERPIDVGKADSPEPVCDPELGLGPLAPCSPDEPCVTHDGEVLTAASHVPDCRTHSPLRPLFDDGPPDVWIDPDGSPRYTCVYRPPGASRSSPRPLVIWLHGGGGVADAIYDSTLLRSKAPFWPLSGVASRPGFLLASVQSRNVHNEFARLHDDRHHDMVTWDLDSPSTNRDLANLDRLVDQLAADGSVDRDRIYVMGWSEGAMLGQLWAIARHQRPTPGGHRVAAAAVYSGTSPFDRGVDGEERCEPASYPTSSVPIFGISRTCDAVACDGIQRDQLWSAGNFADVISAEEWLDDLSFSIGNDNVQWKLIDDVGVTRWSCAVFCGMPRATINHIRWPDGISDGGGIDREPELLAFLRDNG